MTLPFIHIYTHTHANHLDLFQNALFEILVLAFVLILKRNMKQKRVTPPQYIIIFSYTRTHTHTHTHTHAHIHTHTNTPPQYSIIFSYTKEIWFYILIPWALIFFQFWSSFHCLNRNDSTDLSSATHLRSMATILGSKYASTYFDCLLRIVCPQNYEFRSPVQENSFRHF